MKKHLLTGFVILTPVALTLMVILFLIDFFTTPFMHVIAIFLQKLELFFHFHIPETLAIPVSRILVLVLLCAFIVLLGAIARWFLIKQILNLASKIISKIPFVKTIYKTSKDIFSALLSDGGKKIFKSPVRTPFPFPPSYALGFQVGEVAEEIQKAVSEPVSAIFMPTSPHPISGFLFFVPQKDVHKLDVSAEEALKFLISCGMIVPKKSLHDIR